MTATANKETRQHLVIILQLSNCKIERFSPERPNVKISIEKIKFIEILKPALDDLLNSGRCDKTIVYCTSLKLCRELYTATKERATT